MEPTTAVDCDCGATSQSRRCNTSMDACMVAAPAFSAVCDTLSTTSLSGLGRTGRAVSGSTRLRSGRGPCGVGWYGSSMLVISGAADIDTGPETPLAPFWLLSWLLSVEAVVALLCAVLSDKLVVALLCAALSGALVVALFCARVRDESLFANSCGWRVMLASGLPMNDPACAITLWDALPVDIPAFAKSYALVWSS
mmetsp:Transcript_27244/g.60292  ORF Transcript_27244/g.60292 Transcript_27244/m.60292 type:complete len:197 (+) Transcript_27244:225-815(+)